MNEWMNEWMNERMNEWMNERMNERINEWTNFYCAIIRLRLAAHHKTCSIKCSLLPTTGERIPALFWARHALVCGLSTSLSLTQNSPIPRWVQLLCLADFLVFYVCIFGVYVNLKFTVRMDSASEASCMALYECDYYYYRLCYDVAKCCHGNITGNDPTIIIQSPE